MKDDEVAIDDIPEHTVAGEWHPEVYNIKCRLEAELGTTFNYAELNYYRNGADHIGMHRDNELQEGDLVAALSLGVTRRFRFRQWPMRGEKGKLLDPILLTNGSVLSFNCEWGKSGFKHQLMKERGVTGARICITFRAQPQKRGRKRERDF